MASVVFVHGVSRYKAKKMYPQCVIFAKVDGGYACFYDWYSYRDWRNQK